MKLFSLLLLLPQTALAAPSLLGLCSPSWDCSATKKLYAAADRLELSWIENTFAETCKCADELLQDPREKIIRVHLMNSPCMRNKRCGRYEALWGYNKASASRAVHIEGSRLNKRFDAILARFKARIAGKDVSCLVSPCLECDLNERARRSLGDRISTALPSCILVDNPYKQPCLKNSICEYHGTDFPGRTPCIADLDGTSGVGIDLKKWSRQVRSCELRYYWEPWMNCTSLQQFIDPRKRDCGSHPKTFERVRDILCQSSFPSFATCSR